MFTAVIFDLDGIITDTARYHFRAWKSMAATIGIEIDETFNESLKGVSRSDSLDRILDFGGKSACFDRSDRERLMSAKNDDYVASLADLSKKDILPGIEALLFELREHNIKIGLASASKNAEFILSRLQVRDLVDAVADPSNVAHGKPAPDLFLESARMLGELPIDCIGIEDAVAGIQSINAAGMLSIGVGDPEFLSEANFIFAGTELLTFKRLCELHVPMFHEPCVH